MLMAGMRTNELLDVIEQRPMWSVTTTTTYKPSHKPVERHRSLIRCDYCDMSYDGDEHENCPHCLAPRPRARPRPAAETPESTVFYRDDVPYYTSM